MKCFEWLFLCALVTLLSSPFSSHGNVINEKVLHVGEELFTESLPLQNGARLYHLKGLKPQMWYEVKISYPASIPASFSLQLKRGTPDVGLNRGRKLLNTEKIIFKADGITSLTEQGEMSVLVNLEPEGVVAIPGKQEREYAVFNIVDLRVEWEQVELTGFSGVGRHLIRRKLVAEVEEFRFFEVEEFSMQNFLNKFKSL